jgi:hypothetical protein
MDSTLVTKRFSAHRGPVALRGSGSRTHRRHGGLKTPPNSAAGTASEVLLIFSLFLPEKAFEMQLRMLGDGRDESN